MSVRDIDKIAVLGAGSMGHGIAEIAALAGYQVSLRDIETELVEEGIEQIEWSLGKLAEKERITDVEADAARDRITPHVDLEPAITDADVVIEAIVERMDVKTNVYAEVCEHVPDHVVLVSNTSSLSITDLGAATDRPERFCGMHFFNPAVKMQLVEVIAGDDTADETLATIEDLAESMGKEPVRVRKDRPGFVVNRILVPLMNEAAWLVHEGTASIETVDSTAKYDIGLPMGAFELADTVGLDVGVDVLRYMHEQLGAAYEPCPLLVEKVEAGDLGEKTGVGFYDHEGDGPTIPMDAGDERVERRLLAVMANEVAKLRAGDVARLADIDRAVELGGGFPDGPARLADDAGLETLLAALESGDDGTVSRYEPAPYLRERAAEGGFYDGEDDDGEFDTLRIEHDGAIATLYLDRPQQLNSITDRMLAELPAAADRLDADDDVRAIVFRGAGDRAFSSGADVKSLTADGADREDAIDLSRTGQSAFGRFEEIGTPVIAAVDGYCLGGGMELATCADLRIASTRATFGQPEHDLGLLPGWGGTQRLAEIVGLGRAKEIVFTADRYEAETMAEYGFVNEVVDPESFDGAVAEFAGTVAAGPPIAQRHTKRAMLAGRDDRGAGLAVEAEAFGHVVDTQDVLEGVAAMTGDREPEFEGK